RLNQNLDTTEIGLKRQATAMAKALKQEAAPELVSTEAAASRSWGEKTRRDGQAASPHLS
ncbi:MAG: hypothetical protein KGJ06_02100, partial [Pseudomonadota bacterium]|nr:hypothetical protein [Pseudomonadota bacterium]